MACFIVYTVAETAVTIVGVFTTHEAARRCCEKIHSEGNHNVWMVCRTLDKSILPHRIECGV